MTEEQRAELRGVRDTVTSKSLEVDQEIAASEEERRKSRQLRLVTVIALSLLTPGIVVVLAFTVASSNSTHHIAATTRGIAKNAQATSEANNRILSLIQQQLDSADANAKLGTGVVGRLSDLIICSGEAGQDVVKQEECRARFPLLPPASG